MNKSTLFTMIKNSFIHSDRDLKFTQQTNTWTIDNSNIFQSHRKHIISAADAKYQVGITLAKKANVLFDCDFHKNIYK